MALKFSSDGFYHLSNRLSNRWMGLDPETAGWDDLYDYFIGSAVPEEPVRMIHAHGGVRLAEFLWSAGFPLVSKSVVSALEQHQFKGWEPYPVTIHDRKGDLIGSYAGLTVTGRCGEIQVGKGVSKLKERDLGGKRPARYYKGMNLDASEWDQSDLFIEGKGKKRGYILASAELVHALKGVKARNVTITPLEDVEIPVELVDQGT